VNARPLEPSPLPPSPPKHLRPLQGVRVARDPAALNVPTESLGVATYAGRQGHTHFFSVSHGTEGGAELLTVTELRRRLALAETAVKQAQRASRAQRRASAAAANTRTPSPLPLLWTDVSVEGVSLMLEQLMPGEHNPHAVHTFSSRLPGCTKYAMWPCPVWALLNRVALWRAGLVLVPWGTHEAGAFALSEYGCSIRQRHKIFYDVVPLTPSFQAELRRLGEHYGAVCCVLPDAPVAADLMLLSYSQWVPVTACLVGQGYLRQARAGRLGWLRRLQAEGLLSVCPGEGPTQWIVVFESAELRNALMVRESPYEILPET
jgi:hypothetical protein